MSASNIKLDSHERQWVFIGFACTLYLLTECRITKALCTKERERKTKRRDFPFMGEFNDKSRAAARSFCWESKGSHRISDHG